MSNAKVVLSLYCGKYSNVHVLYFQNPKSCSTARKVVCNMSKGCGYGCQLHHVVYCLLVAYSTQRTLVLESKGWRYATGGWETVFRPLSGIHKIDILLVPEPV